MKEEMKEVRDKIFDCTSCSLYKDRKYPVVGQGNHSSKIVFIGEAPGKEENLKGRPFAGKSGKIFDRLLKSVKLDRNDIYVTNIIKCRPEKNRNPTESEIDKCSYYLRRQIEILGAIYICPLGSIATKFIFNLCNINFKSISKVKGKVYNYHKYTIIPFYHPATALYNPDMLNELIADFKIIKEFRGKLWI